MRNQTKAKPKAKVAGRTPQISKTAAMQPPNTSASTQSWQSFLSAIQQQLALADDESLSLPPVSKVRDGLFIGTYEAAASEEFITSNRITHVVNCAGSHVPNRFMRIGIHYLTFFLLDEDTSIFIDQEGINPDSVYNFIEEAMREYEGVMIHSVLGRSRALIVAAAYMMRKYEWDAAFAVEVVSSCRRIRMRPAFELQLRKYEEQLPMIVWSPELYEEEYVIRNTYFNKKIGLPVAPAATKTQLKVKFKLPGIVAQESNIKEPINSDNKSFIQPTSILRHPKDNAMIGAKKTSTASQASKQIGIGTFDAPPAIVPPPQELLQQCKAYQVFEWMNLLNYAADRAERVCRGEAAFNSRIEEEKRISKESGMKKEYIRIFGKLHAMNQSTGIVKSSNSSPPPINNKDNQKEKNKEKNKDKGNKNDKEKNNGKLKDKDKDKDKNKKEDDIKEIQQDKDKEIKSNAWEDNDDDKNNLFDDKSGKQKKGIQKENVKEKDNQNDNMKENQDDKKKNPVSMIKIKIVQLIKIKI
ncbi:MAG: putative dual specificity phosphatase domain protein [Streblomastix strix]|uniref:Putative dual specificity phosphatase domain protein n=1 Tax=Streblomastix strix TaxID=222440 RepID=A0A5J4VTX0_9EUKA|nr:MAG: putative dual specificity phosphatase domain protein [Streblomastix strix]